MLACLVSYHRVSWAHTRKCFHFSFRPLFSPIKFLPYNQIRSISHNRYAPRFIYILYNHNFYYKHIIFCVKIVCRLHSKFVGTYWVQLCAPPPSPPHPAPLQLRSIIQLCRLFIYNVLQLLAFMFLFLLSSLHCVCVSRLVGASFHLHLFPLHRSLTLECR